MVPTAPWPFVPAGVVEVTVSRNAFSVKDAETVAGSGSGTAHVVLVPRKAQAPAHPVKVPPGTTDAVRTTGVLAE